MGIIRFTTDYTDALRIDKYGALQLN